VLRAAGIAAAEIDRLLHAGVIVQARPEAPGRRAKVPRPGSCGTVAVNSLPHAQWSSGLAEREPLVEPVAQPVRDRAEPVAEPETRTHAIRGCKVDQATSVTGLARPGHRRRQEGCAVAVAPLRIQVNRDTVVPLYRNEESRGDRDSAA